MTKEELIKLLKDGKINEFNEYRKETDYCAIDLSGVDLSDADLDFSQLQLSCNTLKTKFDQKHIIQFLFHAAFPCQEYPEIVEDLDLKKLLSLKTFKKVVNKFHRDDVDRIK